MFTGLIARLGLKLLFGRMWTNAKDAIAAIPPKAKLWILAAIAAIALFFVHQHFAHRALKAADQGGYDRARAEDAKALVELRNRAATAERNARTISQEIRSRTDEDARISHAAADDLRLRGAGAASCGRIRDPAVPAAAGGHQPVGGTADAPLGQVPDAGGPELIALPFNDTVAFADDHDQLLIEVKGWRDWYPRMVAEWNKLRSSKGGH